MAFKSSTSSGSFHDLSVISGVPVKISEKFVAPKKITLPLRLETSFQNHNPSEVLFMEYDFDLEENIIKWSEAYKESQNAYNLVETEKVGDAIEQFSRQSPGVAMFQNDSSSDDENAYQEMNQNPKDHSTINDDGAQTEEVKPVEAPVKPKDTNPFLQSLGTDILVPMQASNKPKSDEGSKSVKSFNLSDFERETEQDPFDNAELRVLNDMQELKKVLQTAQPNLTETNTSAQQTQNADLFGPQTSDSGDVNNVKYQATNTQTDIKQIEYPELDSLSSVSSAGLSASNTNYTVVSSQNATSVNPQGLNYSQTNPFAQNNVNTCHLPNAGANNPFTSTVQTKQNVNPYSQTNHNAYENVPNPFNGLPMNQNHFGSNAVSYNKQQETVSGYMFPQVSHANGEGQVKESNRNSFGFLSHGAGSSSNSAGVVNNSTSTLQRLRSCRSTPDITALSDNAAVHYPTSHTPPPNPQAQRAYMESEKLKIDSAAKPQTQSLFSETNPWGSYPSQKKSSNAATNPWGNYPTGQKSTTTATPISDSSSWGNYPELNTPPAATTATTTATSHWNGHSQRVNLVPKHISSLPDPYDSMSKESRTLVDNIAVMGFPKSRVARAVEKLGPDDKQIIDHLCLITRLSEAGYSGDDVESALGLYKKETSAVQYLKLLSQFRELGFTRDKIQDALVTSKLDENKALDILTGNA